MSIGIVQGMKLCAQVRLLSQYVTQVTQMSRSLYLVAVHAHRTNIIWEWVQVMKDTV